ncbi:ABC-2 transporter permease [Solibacillus sp. CAU 1738]|uniref:ABC-2 transporter permease n=1 Tax=Solibacillus sp. CAU 1738 TaxID=3140363 RepID=UPI003260EE10
MQALLIKDFYMLRKQLKSFVLLILFFTFLSFLLDQGLFLISMALIVGTLQVTTAFTFEEMCHWDRYAGALPITKKMIIGSKYALSLALTGGSIIFISPVLFLVNLGHNTLTLQEIFAIVAVAMTVGLVITSVIIPVYIKYGSTKGRSILFAITFFPAFGIGMFTNSSQMPSAETLNKIMTVTYFAPLIALFLLAISYLISVKLYSRKQF